MYTKDAAGNIGRFSISYPKYDVTAPTITAETVIRASVQQATMKFASDEAGTYYYAVTPDEAGDPNVSTSVMPTPTGAAGEEITITLNTLTTGAKDIWISVKDDLDNIDKLKIDIPDYIPFTITPGAVNRTSHTEATVKFTSYDAGQYYYQAVTRGASDPYISTAGVGVPCGTTEVTMNLTGLKAGARDVWVYIKNGLGTISKVKIEIPAFDEPPAYGVSASALNGIVEADKAAYTEKETVTLTITPNTGYELDAIQAYKTNDTDTEVKLDGSGITSGSEYTFTLPAYGVTVAATFRLTDAVAIAAVKTALTWDAIKNANTLETDVQTHFTLSETGANDVTVSWTSSNTAVIAGDGTVTRPAYSAGDASVTLTATISRNGIEDTKVFTLNVTKLPDTEASSIVGTVPANGATNVPITTGRFP